MRSNLLPPRAASREETRGPLMLEDVQRNLTKIRDKDGEVELRWWTPNGVDRESGGLICKDKPEDDFIDTMQALAPLMAKVLELPEGWGADRIIVTTVSLSEDKGGNLAVIISGSCKVKAGGFGLNTPRLHQPVTDAEAGPGTLTPDQWELVAKLAAQAHRYREGERTQRTLGLSEGSEEGDGKDEAVA